MTTAYPIASVAELISDPARSAILMALLDGLALPAGDLARLSGISAQSASGHLSKLLDGGLLVVNNSGRHRYYKIARPEVAHALEALGAISTVPRQPAASPPGPSIPAQTRSTPREPATTISRAAWRSNSPMLLNLPRPSGLAVTRTTNSVLTATPVSNHLASTSMRSAPAAVCLRAAASTGPNANPTSPELWARPFVLACSL